MELQHRKPNRLKKYDYNTTGAYFITICVQNRHEILSKIFDITNYEKQQRDAGTSSPTIQLTPYGKIVEKTLQSIHLDDVELSVDTYIIMPDHIHFVLTIMPIVGGDVPAPRNPQMHIVPRIVTWFKRFTNKEIGFNIWQRSYHDHIIRNQQEYNAICQYIADNPSRWIQKHKEL